MRAKTYSLTHATRQSLRKDTRTTRLSLSVSLCLSVSLSLTYSLCDTRATRPSRASTLQISGIPPSFLFPKKKKLPVASLGVFAPPLHEINKRPPSYPPCSTCNPCNTCNTCSAFPGTPVLLPKNPQSARFSANNTACRAFQRVCILGLRGCEAFAAQLLRSQYWYSCTSKASKLSTCTARTRILRAAEPVRRAT